MFRTLTLLCALVLAGYVRAITNTTVGVGSLSFSGTWTEPQTRGCQNEDLRWSQTIGDSVSYTFTGTAVYFQTTFAYDRGVIAIELDGQEQDKNAWVDDSTKLVWFCGTLFSAQGLENKQHTIKATIKAANNGISKLELIGVVYSVPDASDNQTTPPSQAPPQQTTTQQPPAQTTTPASNPPPSTTSSQPQTTTSNTSTQTSTNGHVVTSNGQPATTANTATPSGLSADVTPSDPRLSYSPSNAWFAASSDTSASKQSTCSTGTQYTTTAGASITFPFTGTALYLKTIPSSSSGQYTVSIDGQTPETHDGYLASSNQCSPTAMYSKTGLVDTDHVVVITIAGASNKTKRDGGTGFEFAGFTYFGANAYGTNAATTPPASNENQSILIGGSVGGAVVAILIAGLATFFYLRHRQSKRLRGDPLHSPNTTAPSNMSRANTTYSTFSAGMQHASQPSQNTFLMMSPNRRTVDPQHGAAYMPGGVHQAQHGGFESREAMLQYHNAYGGMASPPPSDGGSAVGYVAIGQALTTPNNYGYDHTLIDDRGRSGAQGGPASGRSLSPAGTSRSGDDRQEQRPVPPQLYGSPPPDYAGNQMVGNAYRMVNHEGAVLH